MPKNQPLLPRHMDSADAMGDKVESITSLRSLTLDLPPSCIEFCPSHPSFFIVGTYNLEKEEVPSAEHDGAEDIVEGAGPTKKSQSRNGSLVVFQLEDTEVVLKQTVQYPSAILDLHFHPSQSDVLAVVSSTGVLSFFRLSAWGQLVEVISHSELGPSDGVLFLSCAWHPVFHNLLAITTSDFHVHIFHISSDWNAHVVMDGPAALHQLEVWTSAFSPMVSGARESSEPLEFTLFSGGDDSKLLASTIAYSPQKCPDETLSSIEPLYSPRVFKGHDAGVTAILPLPLSTGWEGVLVVTGSYDDHIRVYRYTGPFQIPQLLAEKNLGGGVWRLKIIVASEADVDEWQVVLLASCMHAGAQIVRLFVDHSGHVRIVVSGRFEEHKSMNYGSDYAPCTVGSGSRLKCISTSFYDRLLCLWECSI